MSEPAPPPKLPSQSVLKKTAIALTKPIFVAPALAVLVVAIALALLSARRDAHRLELDQRYERTAAHVGRQVELRLESFAKVSRNLGPIADGGKKLSETQAAALDAKNNESIAKREHDVALSQRSAAERAEQAASDNVDKASARERAAAKKANKLKGKQKKAWAAANEALVEFADGEKRVKQLTAKQKTTAKKHEELTKAAETALAAVTQAAARVAEATRAMEALPAAPERPVQPAKPETEPKADPASQDTDAAEPPAATPAETSADAVSDATGSALAAFSLAQAMLDTARTDATAAASKQSKSRDEHAAAVAAIAAERVVVAKLRAAADAAVVAAVDAEQGSAAAARTQKALKNTTASARATQDKAARHSAASQRTEAELALKRETLGSASAQARSAWRSLLGPIVKAAPPSYEERLNRCLDPGGNQKRTQGQRVRCLFRELLAANRVPREQLRYSKCTYPKGRPWERLLYLSPHRKTVQFPIISEEQGASGCLQTSIKSLLSSDNGETTNPWLDSTDAESAEVVLLAHDGSVVHVDERSQLRLERLPGLTTVPVASTTLHHVEIGSTHYRVYLQPVASRFALPCASGGCPQTEPGPDGRLRAAPRAIGSGLVVAVLVREHRIEQQSVQSGPLAYIALALTVGVFILALPTAKLWSLSPWSEYSRVDVVIFASSVGLAALVATVAIGAALAHIGLTARLDTQLAKLGHERRDSIARDMRDAQKTLQAFTGDTQLLRDGHHKGTYDGQCTRLGGTVGEWHARSWRDKPAYCEQIEYVAARTSCGRSRCRQLVWSDADGYQRAKFSTGAHAAVPVNIATRRYFKRAAANTRCDAQFDYIAEVVRSASTLEMITIVAQPTCRVATEEKDAHGHGSPAALRTIDGVASVSYVTGSLHSPAAPPGARTVIVDATGRVMLHSDGEAHHGNDFFGDVADSDELRALIESRTSGSVQTRYLQAAVRLRVTYVPECGWFVVTMAPRGAIDTGVTGMVVLAFFGSGAFLAVLFINLALTHVAVRLIRSVRTPSPTEIPPPNRRLMPRYTDGYTFAALFSLAFMAAAAGVGLLASLFWGCLAILTLVCIAIGILARRTSSPAGPAMAPEKRISIRYALWYAALTSLFYATPGALFFGGAYDRVVENQVRAEQLQQATELQAYGDSDRAEENAGLLGSAEAVSTEDPSPHYMDLLPNFWLNERLGGHLHRVDWDDGQSTRWRWERLSSSELRFSMLDKSGDQVVPPWTTRLPGLLELGGGWRRGLPLLLVVVIAIPLLFYVLYASLRRLHFLDVLDAPDAAVQPPSDMLHRIDSDPALQRVVANLVLQGIVTPHPDNRDAVRTLVAWRVIDPETLVLDAPELVTHIRAHHRNGTLHKAPENGGSWQVLKMPVVTALLVAAGALAALQPDMGAVGLLAPGLAAALPVVLRAIAAFATQLDGNG